MAIRRRVDKNADDIVLGKNAGTLKIAVKYDVLYK